MAMGDNALTRAIRHAEARDSTDVQYPSERGIVLSAGAIRGFPDPGVLCRLLATSPFAGFPVFASPGTFAAGPAHLVALPG